MKLWEKVRKALKPIPEGKTFVKIIESSTEKSTPTKTDIHTSSKISDCYKYKYKPRKKNLLDSIFEGSPQEWQEKRELIPSERFIFYDIVSQEIERAVKDGVLSKLIEYSLDIPFTHNESIILARVTHNLSDEKITLYPISNEKDKIAEYKGEPLFPRYKNQDAVYASELAIEIPIEGVDSEVREWITQKLREEKGQQNLPPFHLSDRDACVLYHYYKPRQQTNSNNIGLDTSTSNIKNAHKPITKKTEELFGIITTAPDAGRYWREMGIILSDTKYFPKTDNGSSDTITN